MTLLTAVLRTRYSLSSGGREREQEVAVCSRQEDERKQNNKINKITTRIMLLTVSALVVHIQRERSHPPGSKLNLITHINSPVPILCPLFQNI